MKKIIFLALLSLSLSACSTSPMKERLEKNMVYHCTLNLLDRGVAAAEADRICTSVHRAELAERALIPATVTSPVLVPATPVERTPASSADHAPSAVVHPDAKATEVWQKPVELLEKTESHSSH